MSFSDYYGLNLLWFLGVVESRVDPLKVGRCKVRCFGFHTEDTGELPTEDLPWAHILLPPNSHYEIKPPKEGSWVMGFFRDGKKCQEPMILSIIPGIPMVPAELGSRGDSENTFQGFQEFIPMGPAERPIEEKKEGFYDLGKDKGTRPFPPEKLDYNVDGKKIKIEKGESDLYPTISEGYLKQPVDEPDTVRVARNDPEDRLGGKFVNKETELPKNSHVDIIRFFRIGGKNFEPKGIKKSLSKKTVCEQSAYSKDYSKNTDIDRKSDNAESDIDNGENWKEKDTSYNSVYPYNKVEQTESGHVFEIDDTKGFERIHQQHRSGTFYEIHPDGAKVEKIMADNFHFVQQNEYKLNLGNYEITIKKNKGESVEGDVFINIDGERTLRVGGNSYVEVEGNDSYVTRKNREQTTRKNKDETVFENRTEVVKQNHTETVYWNQTQTFGTEVDEHIKTETVNGKRIETVLNNHTEIIGTKPDEHVKTEIVKGKRIETVMNDHLETIGTDPDSHKKEETVIGKRIERVFNNHTETIGTDPDKHTKTETVKGKRVETVESNHTETISGTHNSSSEKTMTLNCKGATIRLNPDGTINLN